jgi:hypothetical protein
MTITQEILHMHPVEFWIWMLFVGGIAAVCFYVAFSYLRRSRLIEDMPTARVRSAPQGYVELDGIAQAASENPLISPLTDTPCCWYRYEIERKGDKNWRTVEKGTSENAFVLEDETGKCIVLPKGAEVTPSDQSIWYGKSRQPDDRNPLKRPVKASVGGFRVKFETHGFGQGSLKMGLFTQYRYTEERIYSGDPVYVLGHFRSLEERDHHRKKKEMTSDILKIWKQDKQRMVDRFDQDGDGTIDMNEWEDARQSAKRIANEKYEQQKKDMIIHTLSKSPIKGFPFLISSLPQFDLAKRYSNVAVFLLVVFFLSGSGAVFLLSNRF